MKNDLISRKAIKEYINQSDLANREKMTLHIAINNIPTTAAAPPVVRCRCCKHAKTAKSHPQWNCNHAQSPCYRRRVRGIDYCAYGEEWTGSDGGEGE